MRWMKSLLAVSFCLLPALHVAAADAVKEKAPAAQKPDKELVQGTWKVVHRVKNGEKASDAEVTEMPVLLKFDGDGLTEIKGGEKKDEGTYALDASKTPKQITMTGKDGRVFQGIYELAGDTLKITYSFGEGAATPPKDFSGGKGSGLLVLERQKDS